MSLTVLSILYTLHLLAAVVWIGGLAMLALVVTPGLRRVQKSKPDAHAPGQNPVTVILAELDRRFAPLANLSLVGLIVTGMLQMSVDENYGGFLQFSNTWALAMLFKHLAVLGMILVAGYVALLLEPERRRLRILDTANRPDEKANQHLARRRARLAKVNLTCGLLTLLFTAIATAQ